MKVSLPPEKTEEYVRVNIILREYYEVCHQWGIYSTDKQKSLRTKLEVDRKKANESFWLFLKVLKRFLLYTYPQVKNRLEGKKADDFERLVSKILSKIGLKKPKQNEKILFSVPTYIWWELISRYAGYVAEAGLLLESEILTTKELVKRKITGMI